MNDPRLAIAMRPQAKFGVSAMDRRWDVDSSTHMGHPCDERCHPAVTPPDTERAAIKISSAPRGFGSQSEGIISASQLDEEAARLPKG